MGYSSANSSLIKGSSGSPLLVPSVSSVAVVLGAQSSWRQAVLNSNSEWDRRAADHQWEIALARRGASNWRNVKR